MLVEIVGILKLMKIFSDFSTIGMVDLHIISKLKRNRLCSQLLQKEQDKNRKTQWWRSFLDWILV
jgi:hypothetical protein